MFPNQTWSADSSLMGLARCLSSAGFDSGAAVSEDVQEMAEIPANHVIQVFSTIVLCGFFLRDREKIQIALGLLRSDWTNLKAFKGSTVAEAQDLARDLRITLNTSVRFVAFFF